MCPNVKCVDIPTQSGVAVNEARALRARSHVASGKPE